MSALRVSAEEVLESLKVGDHDAQAGRLRTKGLLGLVALHGGAIVNLVLDVLPRRGTGRVKDVLVVVANPVEHGATFARAIVAAVREQGLGVTLVADPRLASPDLTVDRGFPALGMRSVARVATIPALVRGWRLAGHAKRWSPPSSAWSLSLRLYLVLAQYLRYESALASVDLRSCRAVVSDFDRASYARPLVRAAQAAGIPTITMVHGTPTTTYLPVLSDEVLVWGLAQEAFFRRESPGVEVRVVGRPEIDRRLDRSASIERVLLCHSMEDLSPDECRRVAHVLDCAGKEGMVRELRPHPRDRDVRSGTGWPSLAESVDLVRGPGEPLAEYVEPGDLVLVVTSTSAVDALSVGARCAVMADDGRVLSCDLELLRESSIDLTSEGSGAASLAIGEQIVSATGAVARERVGSAIRAMLREPE